MTDLFTAKAPGIMRDLMRDLGFSRDDAGAVLGNIGHECGGFKLMQELRPTVAGSAGGYGWCQWTGPRRRAFEAWCKAKGLAPISDAANYGYLLVELKGSEASAVPTTKAAKTLYDKVVAFESHFERAGVKHYDSRLAYAQKALAAFAADTGAPASVPTEAVIPASAPTPPQAPPTPVPPLPPIPVPDVPVTAPKPGFWQRFLAALSKGH